MRLITAAFLLAFIASVATTRAQSGDQESPQVVVIDHEWAPRHFRPEPPAFDDSLNRSGVDRQPSSIPDSIRAMQNRPKDDANSSGAVDGYVYKATVKNVGAKIVRRIGWEYTIADRGGENTAHHYFDSRTKIPPGKQKTLSKFARTPPASTVDAGESSKRMVGQVIIHYVEYEDGSVWRKGSAPDVSD